MRLLAGASDPGDPARPNEDRWGFVAGAGGRVRVGFVIDGATGLGGRLLPSAETDAAWLAAAAQSALTDLVQALPRASGDPAELVRKLVRSSLAIVRDRFSAEAARAPDARYERPTAALQLAARVGDALVVAGLGDSVALVETAAGLSRHVPLIFAEAAMAARHLASDAAARLAELRAIRDRHNRPDGYWCYGLDPDAADHLDLHVRPFGEVRRVLLATDGFSALSDDYGVVDDAGLVATAFAEGPDPLIERLRQVERIEDPDRRRHPRHKVSDDATAVLLLPA